MPITTPDSDTSGIEHGATRLSELIVVRGRYQRATNAELDSNDPLSIVGYAPTPVALETLARVSRGLDDQLSRAFSITGAYGSGKSSFALFASMAMAPAHLGSSEARELARLRHPEIGLHLEIPADHGVWPIHITASRRSPARALLNGLLEGLSRINLPEAKSVLAFIRDKHGDAFASQHPSPREVAAAFMCTSTAAKKHTGKFRGLFVVIDEFGKFLEHAARHPAEEDLQVFQELAESACRSGDSPVILVTILHQAFEEYAQRLSSAYRHEWQKIQGRFIDIPFGDGPDETLRLVGEAIVGLPSSLIDSSLHDALSLHNGYVQRLKLKPGSFSAAEFRDLLANVYPIHPLTLLVLPHVFRRFGQGERSLFSFLSSEDPGGFQEFLSKSFLGGLPHWFGLDALYDYIVSSFGSSLYTHATSKQWVEISETAFRVQDRSELHVRIVKTIGLLHIVGQQCGLLPSKEMLHFAVSDTASAEVDLAIRELERSALITFRQFRNAYRLYEGSDIDIDARLREARSHFSAGSSPVEVARLLVPMVPIVARRHSYETGTLRFLDVRCCRPDGLSSEVAAGASQGDGLLLLCVASDLAECEAALNEAITLTCNRCDVIVGVTVESESVREAAVAMDCLQWVQSETPELRNDRVATRELRERLHEAQQTFRAEWDRMVRPHLSTRDETSTAWAWNGKIIDIVSDRQLQQVISTACDTTYPDTPRLLNELVNRRQLSPAATAARRNVIEAMLTKADQPRLDIKGYPPDASIYASVLLANGVHRPDETGAWRILAPQVGCDAGVLATWEAIERWLFNDGSGPMPVSDLYELLKRPPFGITDGLLPLFVCAVLIVHRDETLVYEDGSFVADLDAATFERMVKRPADFTLHAYRMIGERQAVLERFARGLLRQDERTTIANVVRQLCRKVLRLPQYSLKTRRVNDTARKLRDMIKDSKQPEMLLFSDIPKLLIRRPISTEVVEIEEFEQLFSAWNAAMSDIFGLYAALIDRLWACITKAFGSLDAREIAARAEAAVPRLSQPDVKAFAMRLSDTGLSDQAWVESIATTVVGRPPAGWDDAAEEQFKNSLPSLVSAFRNAEVVAHQLGTENNANEQRGFRLTITGDSGDEHARVVVYPVADAARISQLAELAFERFNGFLAEEPDDIRIAVFGSLAQRVLRENDNG